MATFTEEKDMPFSLWYNVAYNSMKFPITLNFFKKMAQSCSSDAWYRSFMRYLGLKM